MAGSVEARTAPMSRATGKATPNTGQTTSATITAVMSTPVEDQKAEADGGTGDHAQEMPVPPWNRMRATPMLKRSWAPPRSRGSRRSRAPTARSGSRRDEHDHLGNLYERRYELGDESGPEYEAEVAQDVLYFTLYRTRATSFSARVPQLRSSTLFRRTTSSQRRRSSSGSPR